MNQTTSNVSNNTVNANTVNRPTKYQSREKDHCCLRGLKFITSLIAAPFIGLHHWYTIRLDRRKVTKVQLDEPSNESKKPSSNENHALDISIPSGIDANGFLRHQHQSQSTPKSIETNANRCQTPNSQRPAPASLPLQRPSSYNGYIQILKDDDDSSDDEDADVKIIGAFSAAMENKSLPINGNIALH